MRVFFMLLSLAAGAQLAQAWAPLPAAPATRTGRALSLHMQRRPSLPDGMAADGAVPRALATATLSLALLLGGVMPPPANAVSGGVADFVDIAGQDLSGKKFVKKDFSSCDARGVKLVGANLRGSRFFKADLSKADLSGADLTGASLENAKVEGLVLTDAVLVSGYTSQGFEKVKDISGVDFTDAQIRPDTAKLLCKRADATGTNPTTEVDTRESLGCP